MLLLLCVVLSLVLCGYNPYFEQTFYIKNPESGEVTADFYITVDTKVLGQKLDPFCRDLRFYIKEGNSYTEHEFWYEDECGTTSETRIWSRYTLTGGAEKSFAIKYGSDEFHEDDEAKYKAYAAGDWNHYHNQTSIPGPRKWWDGEFYRLSMKHCTEFNDIGFYAFDEAEDRIMQPRVAFFSGTDDVLVFSGNTSLDASYHAHHASESKMPATNVTGIKVNVTLDPAGTVIADENHWHYGQFYDFDTQQTQKVYQRHMNLALCRSKFNTLAKHMVAPRLKSNGQYSGAPPGFKNIVDYDIDRSFKQFSIRVSNIDTPGEIINSSIHSHSFIPGQDVDYPNRGKAQGGVFYYDSSDPANPKVKVNATEGAYVNCSLGGVADSGHSHYINFTMADAAIRDPIAGNRLVGLWAFFYEAETDSLSFNSNNTLFTLANKKPPFGYTEVYMPDGINGPECTLPFIAVSDNESSAGTFPWFQWSQFFSHMHSIEDLTFRTIPSMMVKAERWFGEGTPVEVITADHQHSRLIEKYSHWVSGQVDGIAFGDEYKWCKWGLGFKGFMPRIYKRKTDQFILVNATAEVNLKGGLAYVRNSSFITHTTPETPGGEKKPDPFPVGIVAGAGGGVVGVIGVVCICSLCLLFSVICVLACIGCVILCCLCCCGGTGVTVVGSQLNKRVAALKESKIKEGAQRQMKIAVEKSKFRQEKKKVDEELKIAEEEAKQMESQITELEEEKKRIGDTIQSGSRAQSNMKIINFEDVEQEQKLGKGYLGFRIFRAKWKDETVLFRVFSEKTFKTTRFNIFGNFETELGQYSSLEHPNVLKYIAYSKLPNVGVVTEYCENATLPIYMKRNSLSFEEKVSIVSSIVEGMYYLHQRTVIHKDLQAGNIFITDDLQPKVDFGFNRTFVKKYECSQYAAPELINPQSIPDDDDELPIHEKFDVKCDVFSFGILMYEIAAAKEGGEKNFNPYNLDNPKKTKIAEKVAADPDFRPDFEGPEMEGMDVQNWYINLAQMCWAHKAQERPSFERIKNILKNVSSMGDESDDSSSGSEDEDSD